MSPGIFLAIWLAACSLAAFVLMGTDKQRAVRHRWRIPERTLFGLALIGGAAGILAGMAAFRHKTRHLRFMIGIPLILILQMVLSGALLYWFC